MSAAACKAAADARQQAVGTLGLAACQLSGGLLAVIEADLGTVEERDEMGKTIKAITKIQGRLAATLPDITKRFTDLALVGAVPDGGAGETFDPPLKPGDRRSE